MKLYEYLNLMPDGEKLTVWDKAICELSKLLTITEIRTGGVIVNLSEVIENNIDKLERTDLFTDYDIDIIMAEMERDIAGNVSESWMEQFVAALK